MGIHGQFRIIMPGEKEIVIPNQITREGKDAFLKMLMRADATFVAGGGNFYIGLCDQVPDIEDDLTSITTEPTAAGGYARQAITRDAAGWPTIDDVSSEKKIVSAQATFSASGADFSRAFSRMFLCNASSGTTGTLFCYSGGLTTPITVLDGETYKVNYELFV